MVSKALEENQIELAILTILHNWREHIITKKQMKKYYDGKMTVDRGLRISQNRYQESTLDDMESFIANILIADVKEEDKYTFFPAKIVARGNAIDRKSRYRVFELFCMLLQASRKS